MTTKEKDRMINRLYNMVLDKMRHDFWVHGAGFCQTCGELRKRCECKEFNDKFSCDCFLV